MSYFFERFKWKKLNYGKILNFLPGCYRQRQPYWKKTTNSISAVNHYRIEIFTWFKLHINCIYVFYASSDQIFFILIREKIRLFQKFDTLQRRKFCHQIFNKNFLSKILKNGSEEAFIIILSWYLPNIKALWWKLYEQSRKSI